MFGGLLAILEGVGFNWANLKPRMKLAFLVTAFAAMLFIGYHKLAG